MADGNSNQVLSYCLALEWLLGGTIFSVDFLLLPLGNSDMVLGVQWLCTLGRTSGDIQFNFRRLALEFEFEGKHHKIEGVEPKLRVVEADALHKVGTNGTNGHFYMIKVSPVVTYRGSLMQEDEYKQPCSLQVLLEEFQEVFSEPKTLPPSRGIFDHHIPLQPGAKPVNA